MKKMVEVTYDEELLIKLARSGADILMLKEYTDVVKVKQLNGNNLIFTCSQVVDNLKEDVPNLTTTTFHEWLAHMNFGTYKKIGKKRVFQPNEDYKQIISGKGLAITGSTLSGKKATTHYTLGMIGKIRNDYLDSLRDFVNAKLGN